MFGRSRDQEREYVAARIERLMKAGKLLPPRPTQAVARPQAVEAASSSSAPVPVHDSMAEARRAVIDAVKKFKFKSEQEAAAVLKVLETNSTETLPLDTFMILGKCKIAEEHWRHISPDWQDPSTYIKVMDDMGNKAKREKMFQLLKPKGKFYPSSEEPTLMCDRYSTTRIATKVRPKHLKLLIPRRECNQYLEGALKRMEEAGWKIEEQ